MTTKSNAAMDVVCECIRKLELPEYRGKALEELAGQVKEVSDLAVVFWNSFGTVAIILQEILNASTQVFAGKLSSQESKRACNVLALIECIVSHSETYKDFLLAEIPLYLYGFLQTTTKTVPINLVKLKTLEVFLTMVTANEPDSGAISYLLNTEFIPICLRIMESDVQLHMLKAASITEKILLCDIGLEFVCQVYERFAQLATALGRIVVKLVDDPFVYLLARVVRMYLRLAANPSARKALKECLPDQLRDQTFDERLQYDQETKRCLQLLVSSLETGDVGKDNGFEISAIVADTTNDSCTKLSESKVISTDAADTQL